MATQLEHPDEIPADEDGFLKGLEIEATRLMRVWDKAVESVKKAEGTKDYPRMAIECDLAWLRYKETKNDIKMHEMEKTIYAQHRNQVVLEGLVNRWMAYLQELPPRMSVLEGAYGYLQMQVGQNLHLEKVIAAYNIGRTRTDGGKDGKPDNA